MAGRLLVTALVLAVVVMVTDSRRMTAKEIVDGLMEKSPYRAQLIKDELLDRRDTQRIRLPSGVKAKLVIVGEDPDNRKPRQDGFGGCSSCGGTNLNTKNELPFFHRMLEVITSLKLSTQDGTRNVLRTAFPVLFRPDQNQNQEEDR